MRLAAWNLQGRAPVTGDESFALTVLRHLHRRLRAEDVVRVLQPRGRLLVRDRIGVRIARALRDLSRPNADQ